MKWQVIFFITLFLTFTGLASAQVCYQESANNESQSYTPNCFLNFSGDFTGNCASTRGNDANWLTLGVGTCSSIFSDASVPSGSAVLQPTYIKQPFLYSSPIWQNYFTYVKINSTGTTEYYYHLNITLPSWCVSASANNITLRAMVDKSKGQNITFNCFNGSDFVNLTSTYSRPENNDVSFLGLLYEEAMWWNGSTINITLTSPADELVTSKNATFNATFTANSSLVNSTLYIWNETGVYNITTRATTGLSNTTSIFVNLSSGTYKWNYGACTSDGLCNLGFTNYTLYVENIKPIINQITPTHSQAFNLTTNIDFNCSVTGENLDAIMLYTNTTGSWALNKSISGIVSGSTYNFKLNISEGQYLYTCAVNQTSGVITLAQQGNYTFGIDLSPPEITINSISTTSGSLIFSASVTSSDPHLSTCKYSVYDDNNTIVGSLSNISYTCNSAIVSAVTTTGVYNLWTYALDSLGHEGNNSAPFVITPSVVTIISGGGGATLPSEIKNLTIAPNLETNFFGALSSTAFMLGDINITWFTTILSGIAIFILGYYYKKGGKKVKLIQ